MKPNILLVMTDQQRADAMGYTRRTGTDTPFIDELAGRGVVFETAYSAAPVCVPARNSLLTGTFDPRLPRVPNGLALREGCWTLPHALSAAGYETALFGKMHFSPVQARHGFQIVRSCEHLSANAGYGPDAWDDYGRALTELGLEDTRRSEPEGIFQHEEALHPTSWITRQAIEFLERRSRARPYFMVVSYTSPHTPLDPPERYASMYDPALESIPEDRFDDNLRLPPAFAAAFHSKPEESLVVLRTAREDRDRLKRLFSWIRALTRQIDDAVGSLMKHVSLADTVVFYTSDHGDYGGHRGLLWKVPWVPFDDLTRVPFLCVGAGVRGGRRVTELVQSADFALTSLELAGLGPPEFFPDTESLVRILRGGVPREGRAVFSALGLGWPMIRKGRYKLIQHWSGESVLFDLERDPSESQNVAEAHPAVTRDLAMHLHLQLAKPGFDHRAPR